LCHTQHYPPHYFPTRRSSDLIEEWPAPTSWQTKADHPPRRANPMFADQLHTEESGTLASVLTTLGWALVGVLVLVAVWKMFNRYGLPNFEGLAGRFRGALVMGSSTTPEAPPTAPAQNPAATGAAAATAPVQHPADEDEAPAWLSKVLVAIAAVPTLLALPWAAYSVAKLLPIPLTVALPLGVLFDVA